MAVDVPSVTSPGELLESWTALHSRAAELGVPIVVGGKALTEDLPKDMQFTARCDIMRHLVSFAKALEPRPWPNPSPDPTLSPNPGTGQSTACQEPSSSRAAESPA